MMYSRFLGAGILLASTAMSSLAFAGDTWTGFYLGVMGGYTSLDAKTNDTGGDNPTDPNLDGILLGHVDKLLNQSLAATM